MVEGGYHTKGWKITKCSCSESDCYVEFDYEFDYMTPEEGDEKLALIEHDARRLHWRVNHLDTWEVDVVTGDLVG